MQGTDSHFTPGGERWTGAKQRAPHVKERDVNRDRRGSATVLEPRMADCSADVLKVEIEF